MKYLRLLNGRKCIVSILWLPKIMILTQNFFWLCSDWKSSTICMLTSVLHCKANALCYSEALLCSFVCPITEQKQSLAHFMSSKISENFLKGTVSWKINIVRLLGILLMNSFRARALIELLIELLPPPKLTHPSS